MGLQLRSLAWIAAAAAVAPQISMGAAFTAGDAVVYRVGDGTAALSSAATAVFLDEYSPPGTLVQSIAMPTAVSGSNQPCTASGSATSEGLITLSTDGQYIVGTCYAAVPGTAAVAGTSSASINRVVFRVDANGTVDTSTALSDLVSGNNPRGAASVDGSAFWISGATGTIRYAPLGATTSTAISSNNLRATEIFGGQLYASSSSGATRIATVGTGLQTSGPQTVTNLPGTPGSGSPYEFALLDLDAGVAGVDTLYVADDTTSTGGILKFSLVAGTWTSSGGIGPAADAYRGLATSVSGNTTNLFATSAAKLVGVTDTAGYNAAPSTTTTTLLASAATNTAFRGVALAPTAISVPATLTVSAPASIPEGNSGTSVATFTVSLDHPAPAGGVTFQIDTQDGTANAGSDYVAIVAQNGSIAAGQTSTTFNVTIDGDTTYEGDETFKVNLSNIVNATNTTASVTATITDDDAVPTITVGDATLVEGNSGTSPMSFPVTLSNPSAFDVSFTAQTQNGTATAGSDYESLTTTVTIPAGMTSGTIFVGIIGDTVTEPDETFTLALSNPSNATLGNTSATGTITNDDNVTTKFSINSVSHNEGNSGTTAYVFTVSSNVVAPVGGFTINVDTADGTATVADGDYTALHTTVTIPQGATSAPVTVIVNGDTKHEADETFSVALSNPPAGTQVDGTNGIGVGTIVNDDAVPMLTVANVSVPEGNSGTSNATFTVSLSNATSSDVNFTINTADGTATAGSDYVAIVNGNGTITAGSMSTTVNVVVNGDTAVEPDETFTLNLSAITNASNTTASATGTIVNDDFTTIMQIQGHGSASTMAGQSVTTGNNVVTALKSNGFFMQDPVGDNDITTSDGIFVFTSTAPTVVVGDIVTVAGKVSEFDGATELMSPLTVTKTGHTATLPAPVDLSAAPYLPTSDPLHGPCALAATPTATDGYQANNFACLDGMLVTMSSATVTGATFASGADGVHTGTPQGLYATATGAARPFRSLGAQYPGLGAGIPVWSGEPEILEIYYPGLPAFPPTGHALSEFVYNAGTTFTFTGVIQAFEFSTSVSPFYEVYPSTMSVIDPVTPDELVKPVADSAAGTLTIGTQNFLHFFNATADGSENNGHFTDTCTGTGANDTCPTPAEYATRIAKWTKVICSELKSPIVLDLEEVENRSVLVDLASSITSACGTAYVPYTMPGNDLSGINNGLLVRSDVQVTSVTQLFLNTMTTNCSSNPPCLLNDRPPLLMRASWNGYPFAVLAIYDRSLSGLGDTSKPYIGPKRAEEAAQVAQIVQAWQSGGTLMGAGNARQAADGTITQGPFDVVGEANVPMIVAGDFNAYQFTDGYADVTGMIAGTAVRSQNLYWFDGNASDPTPYSPPSPALFDTGTAADPADRYSFQFDGYVQEIDHILLTQIGVKDFVSVSNAHGNADVSEASPAVLDASTPARSGDHDGQVITIAIDRIFANGFETQP